MPVAVSQRPLTVPQGEQQLAVEAGFERQLREGLRDRMSPIGTGVYHYGLTDKLEVQLPPGLAYRLESEDAQLRLQGALVGMGSTRGLVMVPDDPREESQSPSSLRLVTEIGLMSRLRLHDSRALDLGFIVRLDTAVGAQTLIAWFVSMQLTQELGRWVSAGIRSYLGHRPLLLSRPVLTMGVEVPVQVHLTDWLDLTARLSYEAEPLQKGTVSYRGGVASGFGQGRDYLRWLGGLDARFH